MSDNPVIQALLCRRSQRAFDARPLDPDTLDTILRVGEYAPSSMNRQSTIMVVVQDKATIAELSRLNARIQGTDTDPFYGAPTVVIVLADTRLTRCPMRDGGVVMENLMLAAHALGVGSCWVNRAKELFESDAGKAYLQKWGLDDAYVGVGNCILGYPAQAPADPAPRRPGRVIRV